MGAVAFNLTLICYFAASIGFFIFLIHRRQWVSIVSKGSVGLGLLTHTTFIGFRAVETGHGPYTSSFEVAVFCSWLITFVYLFLHWKYKIKDLGAFAVPLVFLVLFYAAFLSQDALIEPRSELQVWLTLHRSLSIVGYAAFTMAFVAGVMYLIQENQLKTKKLGMMYFRMPPLEMLDNLNFKVITIGFPLFTLGFMTGSLSNLEPVQSLLQWDILKTWPLVLSWIIYGSIFFGRMLVGWQGKRAAMGSILGFVSVIFTFLLHV